MWEYKISFCFVSSAPERRSQSSWADCQDRIEHLNKQGEDGWELVCAAIEHDAAGAAWVYHWKRRVSIK